jgi:flavin-dependent dehydrogenase
VVAGRRSYEFEFPHAARGISRTSLDQLLVEAAMRNGAQVITGRSVNSLDELSGSTIVGAWGRWCRIDKDLNRTFVRERRHRSFGFKRHYRGKSNNGLISLYSFNRGYMGVADVENDTVNICGLVDASRLTNHKGRWERFVETLRQEEPAVESAFAPYEPVQETFLSSTPVVFRPRSPVANGVFMVGDASGIVDPLAGNGMAMAIQSALVLAPLLVRLLENPHSRSSVEAEYCSTHAELFLPRIRWSRRVAKLLARPALLEPALRVARGSMVGSFALARTRGNRDEFARLAERW